MRRKMILKASAVTYKTALLSRYLPLMRNCATSSTRFNAILNFFMDQNFILTPPDIPKALG